MPTSPARPPRAPEVTPTQVVLREARRLHRAVASDSPAAALPVLRRLLATRVMPATTLPELFRTRTTVKRKHLLRALAVEAGHASWEDYCRVLPRLDARQVAQAFQLERGASTLKLWFASLAEARKFVADHGGRAVRIGRQAVVLPEAPLADRGAED